MLIRKALSYVDASLGLCLTIGFLILSPDGRGQKAVAAQAPSHPKPSEVVYAAYAALSGSAVPFWLGNDLGLFEKHGLGVNLIYINSSARVMSAILAGDIEVAQSSVGGVVAAYARGGDPVIIGGGVNKINVSIYALPEIRGPGDLKGKKLGISRFGGLYDFSANYALKKWGLQPGKDVVLIQIGDIPSLMGALAANAIQAATLQPPFTIRARELGYHELLDLSKAGLEYQTSALISTRSIIKKSPDTFRKFLRGFSEALAVFHTQKETALRVAAKHLKGIDPFILEKTYEAYKEGWIPEIPYVNHAGMETAINLTPGVEKSRRIRVEEIVDESFVAELERQGFYRALYTKR